MPVESQYGINDENDYYEDIEVSIFLAKNVVVTVHESDFRARVAVEHQAVRRDAVQARELVRHHYHRRAEALFELEDEVVDPLAGHRVDADDRIGREVADALGRDRLGILYRVRPVAGGQSCSCDRHGEGAGQT